MEQLGISRGGYLILTYYSCWLRGSVCDFCNRSNCWLASHPSQYMCYIVSIFRSCVDCKYVLTCSWGGLLLDWTCMVVHRIDCVAGVWSVLPPCLVHNPWLIITLYYISIYESHCTVWYEAGPVTLVIWKLGLITEVSAWDWLCWVTFCFDGAAYCRY